MSTIMRAALPQDNFTMVANDLIRDRRLSPKARLLYIFMQSQPPGWKTSVKALADQVGVSKDAVQSGMSELVDHGYLSTESRRLANGRMDSTYTLGNGRKTRTGPENQDGASHTENQDVIKTELKDGEVRASRSAPENPSRATRIAEGWMPSPAVKAKIMAECSGVDFRLEHAKFVDYWLAEAGARGRKLDWDATWRNWMRRAWERLPESQRRSAPSVQDSSGDPYERSVDHWLSVGNVSRIRDLLELRALPDEKPGDQRSPDYPKRWVGYVREHRDEIVAQLRERGVR